MRPTAQVLGRVAAIIAIALCSVTPLYAGAPRSPDSTDSVVALPNAGGGSGVGQANQQPANVDAPSGRDSERKTDRGTSLLRDDVRPILVAQVGPETSGSGTAVPAGADDKAKGDKEAPSTGTLEQVVVTGEHVRSLEQFTPTGSRLNLSTKDTPATLDVINSITIETRGFLTIEQAADSMPGVTSGGSPGDLSDFHIRGFSDPQITILHNGIYVGPSDMINRPQNAFNVESVEILKGPASVLYGQGAIGGAVNVLNKAPTFGPTTTDFYASYGSFGTTAFGVGGSTTLTDDLAIRVDLSRTASDGYVRQSHGDSFDGTASLLWKPSATLSLQLSLDVMNDHPSRYWGTPLVPVSFATHPLDGVVSTPGYTLDSRMRYVNYNVGDSKISSTQAWPQLFVKWKLADNVTIENYLYYFQANRTWIDSETYTFNPTTNLVDRDRFYVFHKQTLFGDQVSASVTGELFGMKNQIVVGSDYSHLDLVRDRGFPCGEGIYGGAANGCPDTPGVDPFNPVAGSFGPLGGPSGVTKWDDTALFFEDILDVTANLKLVTGGRFDHIALTRLNFDQFGVFDPTISFRRDYEPLTYRVALVYDVNDIVTPYLSYTTGQDPVGENIFTVDSNQNFALGHSRQIEAGIKVSAPDKRGDLTVALYDIRRDNVLQAISPVLSVPVGSEKSRGLEASGGVKVTSHWVVNANLSYDDAKYGHFAYVAGNGILIDASGNEIPNAPKFVANLWTSYNQAFGAPLELGLGLRHLSDCFGDNANNLTLDAYTTVNVYATYRVTPNVGVSFRVDNLTDKAFAVSTDLGYPTQVSLARPRYFQFDVKAHF
jgi:iron complex outermembrane receptor protein